MKNYLEKSNWKSRIEQPIFRCYISDKPRQTKVDLLSVQMVSHGNRATIDVYRAAIADGKRAERINSCLCRRCYYARGRIGCHVMTDALCGLCDTIMHFGNTCVDVLCVQCATAHKLCKRCGSDIDDKNRTKL